MFGQPSWDELLAGARRGAARPQLAERAGRRSSPATPINIQYTSGTTGFPKGATLSHRNILNNGFFVGEGCRYTEHDRICIPVPFYHCFGMVMGNLAATSHGACMVIPAPGFDPAATLRAVAGGALHLAVRRADDVHRDAGRCPSSPTTTCPALRTGIMAGSPCPAEMMKQVIDAGHDRDDHLLRHDRDLAGVHADRARRPVRAPKVGTVGRVGPHLEIKVVDPETGETLPRGEPGEFCTRGYSVMLGYWDEPEKTAEAIVDGLDAHRRPRA